MGLGIEIWDAVGIGDRGSEMGLILGIEIWDWDQGSGL